MHILNGQRMVPLDMENSDISNYEMGGSQTRVDSLDGASRIFRVRQTLVEFGSQNLFFYVRGWLWFT